MKGTEWLEMRKCGTCGKRFAVMYPHLWRFKRKPRGMTIYFCSYGCVQKWDRGGVEEMEKKVPDEVKKKAIETAISGGDPFEELRPYTTNPKSMWSNIKIQLKKKDPEKWAKIPNLRTAKEPEAQKPEEKKPRTEITINADGIFVRPAEDKKEDIFEKIEIRSTDSGMIYKRAEGGMTMILDGKGIYLNERTWKQLAEEIPKALKTLGVDS